MIYTFKLVSAESDGFMREIRIDADSTFSDLRDAVNAAAGYEPEPMCSFFICDSNWEKETEITYQDMGFSDDPLLMDRCQLADYIDGEGQRLLFVFDYLTDRAFFMKMSHIETGADLAKAECVRSVGDAPVQFIDQERFIDETLAANAGPAKGAPAAQTDEFDADGYGDDSYDDEDIVGLSDDIEI